MKFRRAPLSIRTLRGILFVAFVASGFSGLIYESVWSHYLKLFLGHAAYAQTLVLAIFMGGMAVGSWYAASVSRGWRNPMLAYAYIEAAIGLIGFAFHPSFVITTDFAYNWLIPASGTFAPLTRIVIASALMLPQSILLGMTFPLIAAGLVRLFKLESGATLAWLYFSNSLGAAAGVLTSGFFLISLVGLPGTLFSAALINILLALVVWLLVRGNPGSTSADLVAEPQMPSSAGENDATARLARLAMAAAFVGGTACFLYEVAWIRMLSLVLGSSSYAFELMLSAFILGLALGGFAVRRRIDRAVSRDQLVGTLYLLTAVCAAATIVIYNHTFDLMATVFGMFARTEAGYVGYNLASHGIAALVMLPTALFAGMALPALTALAMRHGLGEKAIGRIYAWNTLGAIFGVAAAMHLLMPYIGTKGVVLTGASLHAAVGVAYLRRGGLTGKSGLVCALALTVFVAAALVSFDPLRMASTVYRSGLATLPADAEVLYLRDGKTATIALVRQQGTVQISTNGKPDASIQMDQGQPTGDEITMVLAGAVPLAMHPAPGRVANIGIGSGLTSHTLLLSQRVKTLSSVEIEPFMAEAARLGFGARVGNVFEDPRSRIIFDDAKSYFAATREPYDMIVSEPSNPYVSGVSTLFSQEFYRRIIDHLKPDGLFVQWLQAYDTDISVVVSVMKALSPKFSDYALFNIDDSNLLIIATPHGALPRPRADIFAEPELQAELGRLGIRSLADIEGRRIGDKRFLDPLFLSYPVPANSDYFPFVERVAPRMRFLGRDAGALSRLTSLPVPVSELLGSTGTANTVTAVEQPANVHDILVNRSLILMRAVTSGNLDGIPPEIAQAILTLGITADRCASASGRRAWLDSVWTVARNTTSFVSPGQLASLWRLIDSAQCRPRLLPDEATWLDFLRALALRDRNRIIVSGQSLMQGAPPWLTADERAGVLSATAAALIGAERKADARTLLAAGLPELGNAKGYELAMRWLSVLARGPAENAKSGQ